MLSNDKIINFFISYLCVRQVQLYISTIETIPKTNEVEKVKFIRLHIMNSKHFFLNDSSIKLVMI